MQNFSIYFHLLFTHFTFSLISPKVCFPDRCWLSVVSALHGKQAVSKNTSNRTVFIDYFCVSGEPSFQINPSLQYIFWNWSNCIVKNILIHTSLWCEHLLRKKEWGWWMNNLSYIFLAWTKVLLMFQICKAGFWQERYKHCIVTLFEHTLQNTRVAQAITYPSSELKCLSIKTSAG